MGSLYYKTFPELQRANGVHCPQSTAELLKQLKTAKRKREEEEKVKKARKGSGEIS
jgi:hypothetical protein